MIPGRADLIEIQLDQGSGEIVSLPQLYTTFDLKTENLTSQS